MSEASNRQLKARIALALLSELGRKPTAEEVERYARLARVLYKSVLGLHFERRKQKQQGQLRLY